MLTLGQEEILELDMEGMLKVSQGPATDASLETQGQLIGARREKSTRQKVARKFTRMCEHVLVNFHKNSCRADCFFLPID